MKLAWKYLCALFFCGVLLMTTGCTGINASHSVSPASFFLPGLIQVDPAPPVLPDDPEQASIQIAVNSPTHH